MKKGLQKNCESVYDIWGVHLAAPRLTGFDWPGTGYAGGGTKDFVAAGGRNALTVQVRPWPDYATGDLFGFFGLDPSKTEPPVDEPLLLPEIDVNDIPIEGIQSLYRRMIAAAKVPSSYPYKSCGGTELPSPSSAEDPCKQWKVDLVSVYDFLARRIDPIGSSIYYSNILEPYLNLRCEGRYRVRSSRVIRLDGKPIIVTYHVTPIATSMAYPFGVSTPPQPEEVGPITRPPDITDTNWMSILGGQAETPSDVSSPYIHFQLDVETQQILRQINLNRMCIFGKGEFLRTSGSYTYAEKSFYYGIDVGEGLCQDYLINIISTQGGGNFRGCNNLYYGKDVFMFSGYSPYLTEKGTALWGLSKFNYNEVIDGEPSHPIYSAGAVGQASCKGSWPIVMPSCRAFLLSDPPPAKDLSGYGFYPPSERLPDEPWVIAFNKTRTRVVTGRALNKVFRTGPSGSFYETHTDFWDGTLTDDEIENVILWDNIPAGPAKEAGLASDFEITDIAIRAYQHINGKDYVILGVPDPAPVVELNYGFESYKPYFRGQTNTETGGDCPIFVGKEGKYDFNLDSVNGVSNADDIGVTWIPEEPATNYGHYWNALAPINPKNTDNPIYPFNSGRDLGAGATGSQDDRYDEGRYRVYYGRPGIDECSVNPMDWPVTEEKPGNTTQYLTLGNDFQDINSFTDDAVIQLSFDTGPNAVIEFDWRFDNRMWEVTAGGTYNLKQTGTPLSFLEVRLDNVPIIGRWSITDAPTEVFAFKVDHCGSNSASPIYANSFTPTTGTETGTYANTVSDDGTYHSIAADGPPDGGTINGYYEFIEAEDSIQVQFKGYLTGGVNNQIQVEVYKWATDSWDEIGGIRGQDGTADVNRKYAIVTLDHIGTGDYNLGKIRIRFRRSNDLVNATLKVDYLYVSSNQVPTWDQPGDSNTFDHWRRFRKTDWSENASGSEGSHILEIRAHCGVAAPYEAGGAPIGRALIDNIRITGVLKKIPADEYVPFYYDGNELRYLKHKTWAWRDEGTTEVKPIKFRTKRSPDYITVRNPKDIKQDNPDRKILYGNEFYLCQVNQDGTLDQAFFNVKDTRQFTDTNSGKYEPKPGFVRWTASPEQKPQEKFCDDDGNAFFQDTGDGFYDVPWGFFQILPTGCSIQVRGAHGAWRDATELNLLPLRIKDSEDPATPPVDGQSQETQGLAAEEGWEDYSWYVAVRPNPLGNIWYDNDSGWTMRCQGWTIREEGKIMIPHVDVVWAPWLYASGFPEKGPYESPPYPPKEVWDMNRPRDPRHTTWSEDPNDPTALNKPLQFSKYNYIIPRGYTDADCHVPQFVWSSLPDFVPDPDHLLAYGLPDYVYPKWTMVPAWETPLANRFPHGDVFSDVPMDPNLWRTYYTTLTTPEYNTCQVDEDGFPIETGTIRRSRIIRPESSNAPLNRKQTLYGQILTDFDAVDCDCDCG